MAVAFQGPTRIQRELSFAGRGPGGAPASTQAPPHSLVHLPMGGTRGWQCGGPAMLPASGGGPCGPSSLPVHHTTGWASTGRDAAPPHTPRWLPAMLVTGLGGDPGPGPWGGVRGPGSRMGPQVEGVEEATSPYPSLPLPPPSLWLPDGQVPRPQSGPGPGSKPREGPSQNSSFY